jgi:hypothetical protein
MDSTMKRLRSTASKEKGVKSAYSDTLYCTDRKFSCQHMPKVFQSKYWLLVFKKNHGLMDCHAELIWPGA